jgi:heme-degrading monooxygenase HmoA
MSHFWPGGTEEQYRKTLEAVHPASGLPDGQTYHAAGPTDGGYLISVIWDSKQQADAFTENELMKKKPVDGGFSGQPEERTAEVANLETA